MSSHSPDSRPVTATTETKPRFIYTLPGVVLVVSLYCLIHSVARALASANLGEDDPFDTLLVQHLAPGYAFNHGPFYDWLLWGAQQLFGTGIEPFLLIKYTFLVITAASLFLVTRRLTGSGLWGFLSVEAMALTYQVFWRYHEGFTHRAASISLASLTLWAVLQLIEKGRWRDYLFLGLLLGLGLLTEHSYAVLILALTVACCCQPRARQRWLVPRMLPALLLAGVLVSPYLYWLNSVPGRWGQLTSAMLPFADHYTFAGMLNSLSDALTLPLFALSPYTFLVVLVFPALFKEIFQKTSLRVVDPERFDGQQLMLHIELCVLALLLVGDGLIFQRHDYAVHSLLPLLMAGVVWITIKIQKTSPSDKLIRRLIILTVVFALGSFVGRCANMYLLEPVCHKCRWGIPYAELADAVSDAGFRHGTIVSNDGQVSGNLRRFFPDERFLLTSPRIVPPETSRSQKGSYALVWDARQDDRQALEQLAPLLPDGVSTSGLTAQTIKIPWPHLWKPRGYRYSTWKLLLIPPPAAG